MKRVFIVGAGSITGAGDTAATQYHCMLCENGPGFVALQEATRWLPFSVDNLHESIGKALVCPVRKTDKQLAELLGINPKAYDRHQLLALVAAKEAMSGINNLDPDRFACVGATGGGGLLSIYKSMKALRAGKRLGPRDNLKFLPNLFVGHLSRQYHLRGPSEVHGTACAASMHAINSLVNMIRLDKVDGGLVVGTDAAISEFGVGSFIGQRALGNGLTYQKDRSGFVMGEGAGALLLCNESALEQYNLEPLAEITGYAATSDASDSGAITDPDPEGAARTMHAALKAANLQPADLSLMKTHGTATGKGDVSEVTAVRQIGAQGVPLMSLKSYYGHLLGAAGIVELVSVVEMMRQHTVLSTRNLTPMNLDPECNSVMHVFEPTRMSTNHVLANGFGFGGTNASMILSQAA